MANVLHPYNSAKQTGREGMNDFKKNEKNDGVR